MGSCNCTVFHFGREADYSWDTYVVGLQLGIYDTLVDLGRSAYTLVIRVRTQCSVWRLQGVGGLEGVSCITGLT